MRTTTSRTAVQGLRLFVWASVLVPVLVGLRLAMFFGFEEPPPASVVAGLVLLAIVLFFLCETIGFRTSPSEMGDRESVGTSSRVGFQKALILRFALGEIAFFASILLTFLVTPRTTWTYVVGAVAWVVLLIVECLPGRRAVARFEDSLERSGHPSYLREGLGMRP